MASTKSKITATEIKKAMRKECIEAVKALGPKSAKGIQDYRRTGRCEICGRRNPDRLLCRDHHHASKNFRGLLCIPCNLALGLIKDDPETAEAMAKYLRKGPVLGDQHQIDFDK